MKSLIFLFVALILFMQSCNKNEDGNWLESKKSMVEGDWRVLTYTVDNQSILVKEKSGMVPTKCNFALPYKDTYSLVNYVWKFTKNGIFIESYQSLNYVVNKDETTNFCGLLYDTETDIHYKMGNWNFSSDKKSINITMENKVVNYSIVELSNKVFSLSGVIDGSNVVIVLQ